MLAHTVAHSGDVSARAPLCPRPSDDPAARHAMLDCSGYTVASAVVEATRYLAR
jgi:hypothetical protein